MTVTCFNLITFLYVMKKREISPADKNKGEHPACDEAICLESNQVPP